MRFIDLSHPLQSGQPAYPGDPTFTSEPHLTLASDRCRVSRLTMGSHQGTHLDALAHFIPDGRTIDTMPLEWFYGPARRLHLPKAAWEEITVADLKPHEDHLTPGARIILATGWEREYGTARYFTDPPSLTQEAARYLAGRGLRLLGMDLPTPGRDFFEIHQILLAHPVEMVLLESLANLTALPETFILSAFPLALAGGDGSPVRAVALIE